MIHESATVVLLKDSDSGLEVLMLQKNSKINYGGSWVFPGGVTEPKDATGLQGLTGEALRLKVSERTVIRETFEETGLEIEPQQLAPFSNWLTPNFRMKRYNTLFFTAVLNAAQANTAIKIDQEEIVDYQWLNPALAITQQVDGSMLLNGPSFVTLKILEGCTDSQSARALLSANGVDYYEPRGMQTDTGVATLYSGDCAYDLGELSSEALQATQGMQHRLLMHKSLPWEFFDTREN